MDFIELFYKSIALTFLILILPYSLFWFFLAFKSAQKTIKSISDLDTFANLGDDKKDLINFKDEKKTIKFTISISKVVFIEALENYVSINYLNKGKIINFILRNSMKNVEEIVNGTSLVRCHRSYMINVDMIKILKKEKDGFVIATDIEDAKDIPVSKTYFERLTNFI